MNFASVAYTLMIAFIAFFITTNVRDNLKYKKENLKVLFYLNEDDKAAHLISSLMMVVLILFAGVGIIGMINTKIYNNESVLGMIIMPLLMIILYLPMMKKTRVSNLGIHKKNYLIRWDDIKGINYLKPNNKNKVKVKILYTVALKETSVELTFNKDDAQLDTFKETVKECRNVKKKDKKSGK